ncbi:MAG: anti-sigma factor family protein [Deltaproteobacteria bacterium]
MNCLQVDEYIFSYCDGELASSLSSELESHIANCDDCRAKVELTRMETDIIRNELFMPALSAAFTAGVMSAINRNTLTGPSEIAATRAKKPWYTRTPFWLAATAAAFVLLVYTVSPGLFMPATKTATQQSNTLKLAEKGVATNAVTGSETSQKSEQSYKEKSLPSEGNIDDKSPEMTLPADITIDNTVDQIRTMAGAAPDQVNNELMMKRDSTPDRDRAGASILKATGGSAIPKVSNMPSSFQLVDSSKQEDGWTFIYEGSGKQLTVSLASSSKPKVITVNPEAVTSSPAPCEGPACNFDANTKENTFNSVNRSVKLDGTDYEMTLTGDLSIEELNSLAGILTIDN